MSLPTKNGMSYLFSDDTTAQDWETGSFTISSGTNSIVIVGISVYNPSGNHASPDVLTVKWGSSGGTALTRFAYVDLPAGPTSATCELSWWYLVSPTPQTSTFYVTMSVGNGYRQLFASVFDNAAQATPLSGFNSVSPVGTQSDLVIASDANSLVVDWLASDANITSDGSQTLDVGGAGASPNGSSHKAGDSSVTMTWTSASTQHRHVGASLAAYGAGGPQYLTPTGFADTDAFGAPHLTFPQAVSPLNAVWDNFWHRGQRWYHFWQDHKTYGSPQYLTPTGYADPDAFGAPAVTRHNHLLPTAYTDPDAFGGPVVSRGAITLHPTGYADPDTFGTPTVTWHYHLAPTGYADPDAFGAPSVAWHSHLAPTGYADPDTFGAPTVSAHAHVNPTGYADADVFGAPVVSAHAHLDPTGYLDADAFGSPVVTQTGGGQHIYPTGYVDADLFGAPTVTPGHVDLAPTGFADPDAFGAPTVSARVHLAPTGYGDADAFGTPAVIAHSHLAPAGFADPDSFGAPTVSTLAYLGPVGFADADIFGAPMVAIIGGPSLVYVYCVEADHRIHIAAPDSLVEVPAGNRTTRK